jgi:hypothetical protein
MKAKKEGYCSYCLKRKVEGRVICLFCRIRHKKYLVKKKLLEELKE